MIIAVMNQSTVFTDAEAQSYIQPLQVQWNRDLSPIWPVHDASFVWVPSGQTPPRASWWLVFLDNSDQANALAYHDLTNAGLPISKIFCKTITDNNESISVGASHECLEMAVDPWLNLASQDRNGTFWATEIADPVEGKAYSYTINGVAVSDFVTPDWFAHQHSDKHLDFTRHETKPFQILPGGYAQYFDPSSGWQQVTGSEKATSDRAIHPPIGSRRERRIRQSRELLRRSAVSFL